MKQSKFSLADVITVLTALAFGFICFLGINFHNLGNTSQSIVFSFFIFLLLSTTALGAKLFKRTSRNFKTSFVLEMVMLVLFTCLTILFAFSPFSHYFMVSEQKEEIQKKLESSIIQAENMFSYYEEYAENRKDLYQSKLRSVASAKNIYPSEYANFGFVGGQVSDGRQIETKVFTLDAELFPTNYSDTINQSGIKEVATDWLKKAKSTTSDWKPIGIVTVVNEVEKNSEDWRNQLVELSREVRQNGEQIEDFQYDFSFDDVKNHFTTLGKPTPISIGLALGAYLLMVLSWFVTKRSTKTFGRLASYEVEL